VQPLNIAAAVPRAKIQFKLFTICVLDDIIWQYKDFGITVLLHYSWCRANAFLPILTPVLLGYRQENYPLSTPRGEGVTEFAVSKFGWG
jgi:hypothetical protein